MCDIQVQRPEPERCPVSQVVSSGGLSSWFRPSLWPLHRELARTFQVAERRRATDADVQRAAHVFRILGGWGPSELEPQVRAVALGEIGSANDRRLRMAARRCLVEMRARESTGRLDQRPEARRTARGAPKSRSVR